MSKIKKRKDSLRWFYSQDHERVRGDGQHVVESANGGRERDRSYRLLANDGRVFDARVGPIALVVLEYDELVTGRVGLVAAERQQHGQVEARAPAARAARVHHGLEVRMDDRPRAARGQIVRTLVDAHLAILCAYDNLQAEELGRELQVGHGRSHVRQRRYALHPAALAVLARAEARLLVDPDEAIACDRYQVAELRMRPSDLVQSWIYL